MRAKIDIAIAASSRWLCWRTTPRSPSWWPVSTSVSSRSRIPLTLRLDGVRDSPSWAPRRGGMTRLAYPGVWRRHRDLGAQPVAELGVDEQLTGFCLVVVRNQDPHLDRDDRALEDTHVAVCDLIRDVGPAKQALDCGDYPGVVGPDELRHVRHLR